MRKFVSALVATVFVVQAAPAVASDSGSAKPKKGRKICKDNAETATRMTSRTCLTPTQWRALAKRGRQNEIAEADGDHLLRSNAAIPQTEAGANGPPRN